MTHSSTNESLFVSYATADELWAEWIAWQFEENGYRVRCQKWDFRPGSNFILEMHEATRTDRLVAVLTPEYLKSAFASAEWAEALRNDPLGRHRKILPIRVAPCSAEGLLGARVYVDLVGKTESQARALLLDAVRPRAKPSSPPTYPGTSARGSGIELLAPTFPTALPRIWTVPYPRNPYFIGRDEAMTELRTAFISGEFSALALTGCAGVGKTQLAVQYAFTNRQDYDAVLWLAADNLVTLRANLASLAGERALRVLRSSDNSEANQIEAVTTWLREHGRWLLICDNADADASDAIIDLLPDVATGHMLITSRCTDWPIAMADVTLEVFSNATAVEFLRRRIPVVGGVRTGSDEQASAIARELGGLPLALEHAAAYIGNRRASYDEYLARLQAAQIINFESSGATEYRASVSTTWHVTEAQLAPPARAILRLISWYAPEEMPADIFERVGTIFIEAVKLIAPDGAVLASEPGREGLVQLARFSLIKLTPKTFSVHRLLMRVQRASIPHAEVTKWFDLAVSVFDSAIARDTHGRPTWSAWEELQTHAAQLIEHAAELQRPDRTVPLQGDLGILMVGRSRFHEAAELLQSAVDASFAVSTNPGRTMTLLRAYADALVNLGRAEEAEPNLHKLTTLLEQHVGTDSLQLARALRDHGCVLHSLDRLEDAEPLMRRALAIAAAATNLDESEVARTLSPLGSLLYERHQFDEAEALVSRALDIDSRRLGHDHAELVTHLNLLGLIAKETGRYSDAELHLKRALSIDESAGLGHPWATTHVSNLACVMEELERFVEAEGFYRRAVNLTEAHLGPYDLALVVPLRDHARVLRILGRVPEAHEQEERAKEIEEAGLDAKVNLALSY